VKPRHVPATIDLDALAAKVAPLVASLLLARLTGDVWPKTSKRADAPRGAGRRWPKIAKTIGCLPYPGARHHVVSREQWESYLAATNPTAAGDVEPWTPGKDLGALGLRATRGKP
jgi:hypothetical protein